MHSKGTNITRSTFDEKYSLYGSMLYRLGFIYLGTDECVYEAMQEAFLWLLKGKKAFKDSDEERLELLKYMVLICESKSRKKPKSIPQIEEETSVDALSPESKDMLEALYGLPDKYKPVLHLALYKNLDVYHISKILSIPKPVVKRLLAKGTELMEMVLEKKLDRDYYCSIMDDIHSFPEKKEDIYHYIILHHRAKKYVHPGKKRAALLSLVILSAAAFVFSINNSQIEYAIKTKYILLKEGIASVTIKNLAYYDGSGVLFTKGRDETSACQAYTIKNKKLKPLDTRLVSGSISYLGKDYPINFYCAEKNNNLAIWIDTSSDDYIAVRSIKNNTRQVLAYIPYNGEESAYLYPLIVDINTLETTDFLAGHNLTRMDGFLHAYFNDDLTKAVIFTWQGAFYYYDVNSSSLDKIAVNTNYIPSNIQFNEDETILYSLQNIAVSAIKASVSYYEYSITSGAVRDCFRFNPNDGYNILFAGSNAVVASKANSECYIIDVRSNEYISIPDIKGEDISSLYVLESPDGAHLMLQLSSESGNIDRIAHKIYTYDTCSREITELNLPELKDTAFTNAFWYDNEHIAAEIHDVKYYGFNNNKTATIDRSNGLLSETSLCLFDINKHK